MGRRATYSLTSDERIALVATWNLADAHARQSLSPAELDLVRAFPEMFMAAERQNYVELEHDSASAFLRALGQRPPDSRPIAVYASSIATMVVARLVKRRGLRVQLTWPTFDSLYALLIGEGIEVLPRAESNERGVDLVPNCGAVVEVAPNNPTGRYLTSQELRQLADKCREESRILILDQSFKGQVAGCAAVDHYGILRDAGTSFVILEDTGKLWPTLDLKVAFMICSEDLRHELEVIVDDVLLNVSPFALEVVKRYSNCSYKDKWQSVRNNIATNRAILRNKLEGASFPVKVRYPLSQVGVEVVGLWPTAPRGWRNELETRGVAVLDSRKFYWGRAMEPTAPEMRISLARDSDYFDRATDALVTGLSHLYRSSSR